jgi:site-specific DNA recombinase
VREPNEAAVVERIFRLAAEGWGYKRIAARLNEEAAPAPLPGGSGGRAAGHPRAFVRSCAETCIAESSSGTGRLGSSVRGRALSARPAADVVNVTVPDLAIVDAPLWRAAHERIEAGRALYLARNGGRAFGCPPSGTVSPYLLTGLGTCGVCGGSMCVLTRAHGAQRVPFYGCMTRKQRGRTICPNMVEVPLEAADQAVLLERDVLNAAVLNTAAHKDLAVLLSPSGAVDNHERERRDRLVQLEAEVSRLAGAIAAGGVLPPLLALLQDREHQRIHVQAELATRERERVAATAGGLDARRVLAQLEERVNDWVTMLRQETAPARQALRALLTGRLCFTPDRAGYTFAGEGTITAVIAGAVQAATGVVAPTGFEPVF